MSKMTSYTTNEHNNKAAESGNPCCGQSRTDLKSNTTACCGESEIDSETGDATTNKTVTIDEQVIRVIPSDKNIVDVADRAKIGIPAPCYRAKQRKGCCKGCVVDIDGEQKFACCTFPENGMNIVVNRADLKAIRKQRLLEYKENIKNGTPCGCSTSGSGNCC